MTLRSAAMDTFIRRSLHPLTTATAVVLVALMLLGVSVAPAGAEETADGALVMVAGGEHERRPIAPTQRDQLGLLLYGLMALAALAGGATLRRQLRGERPQSDGEFRWR